MAQPLETLVWTPHANFHRKLQDGNFTKAALDDHFDWLLLGTQKFKPCNDASRKQILEHLKLESKGKSFVFTAKHRPLALRAARLLDLDEIQAMLLLKRWLKDSEPDLKPDDLPENDPTAVNGMLLQVLRYYHWERIALLKCIQVVMLKAGEPDEAGRSLSDLLSRLVKSGLEEQLHSRLRENLEGGSAAITRRLKANDGAAAATAAAAAAGSAGGAVTAAAGGGALALAGGTAASLTWLSAAHGEMRLQLVSERMELLHCLLLLYEQCGVSCKPERAQALARLLLDRVFVSVQAAGGSGAADDAAAGTAAGDQPATAAADSPAVLSQQLAALLLLSCLDLPGHVQLATAAATPGGGAAESLLPLGGKTMDLQNQLSQYAATPSTALLLMTWAGCLRLLDAGGGGHVIRDLDGAAREVEVRAAAAGGLAAAAASVTALCSVAGGALLLVYHAVVIKALCVMCTAFDLGVDTLDPAMYDVVISMLKLCVEGDEHACAAFWDESSAATAPLRALLAAAARLFPAVPRHLLQLLRLTAASPDTARAAYAFLQRNVSLVVLHGSGEGAIRHLGGGEVELAEPLPWNLAPSVPGLALPQGCVGVECPLPAVLAELRGRYVLVAWDAEVSGGGGEKSRGQVLLLGRASHCVASLEHALLNNLPLEGSDPTLLRDLADTLSLLAALCDHEPALAADLLTQSVPFASGTTRSWTDVVAGVLAIGPHLAARMAALAAAPAAPQQQAPAALRLLADAAQLLSAMATLAPGRVLALLAQLPLLSGPDFLAGLPAAVPLAALHAFQVPRSIDAFFGLLSTWTALQRELERPTGRYPLTVALLGLLAGLLERGFVAAPLPAATLWVLHELLPGLHQWRYADAKERWTLTHGSLRVLRLALTAGAFVSDPDISELTVTAPAAATQPAPPPPASGPVLRLTYGSGGGGSAVQADEPAATGAPLLTPEQLVAAATPRLHVSVLSAALLKLLLLHGGVLLTHCLPPPAGVLERLREEDASRPELPPLEECVGELLQLMPPLLAAAGAHPQEQPFEEFLLGGQEPTPAAHVASYIAYHEADQERTLPERQISYLALRALSSLSSCISRPVSRSLPGVSLALAVPAGSAAEACLRALLRGEGATAHPAHHALAAQLAAAAVGAQNDLLNALMFPSELEEQQQQGAAAGTTGGGAGAGALVTVVRSRAGRTRHALDGLYGTLQQAARLKREHPQVLSSALHVLVAMWQQPAAAHRAVAVLRAAKDFWSSLEACLEPVSDAAAASTSAGAAAPTQEVLSYRALCEAYGLQILTVEAFARSRSAASSGDAAAAAAVSGGGPEALLDKLAARGGLLLRLLKCAAEPLPTAAAAAAAGGGAGSTAGEAAAATAAEAEVVGTLQRSVAALYLEMGVAVVAELWGPPGVVDGVSVAPAVREELSSVRALLSQGAASLADIQSVHDDLLAAVGLGLTHGSPGAQSADEAMSMAQLTPPGHPLAQLLMQRQCLGAALVSRCHVSTSDLSQLPGGACPPPPGPDQLLSRTRLALLLGPAAEALQSADLVAGAMCDASYTYSLTESRGLLLQAACALTALLALDRRLTPPPSASTSAAAATLLDPPGGGAAEPATPGGAAAATTANTVGGTSIGGGLLSSVQAACTAAVSSLLSWCNMPDSRATLQPDWGLRRLHAQRLAAALAASRLLLSVVQAARPSLTARAVPPPPGGGGGGGSAAATTPSRSPLAGFGATTPIALTPVATGGRAGAKAAAAAAAAAGGGGGVAADPAYLPFVAQLAQQLASWARVVATSGLPQCPPQAVLQITDALAGSLLLALQPLPAEAAAAAAAAAALEEDQRQQLGAALLSALPQLCELAACGGISTPLATQLLLECTRHLATHDWLPLLLVHMDLGQHILAAAGRAAAMLTSAAASASTAAAPAATLRSGDAAAAAGDLGMLSLALAVAQVPDGARALYDRGIVEQLVAAGRHLLSAAGGKLATFSVVAVTGTGPYRPRVDGTYGMYGATSTAGMTRGSLAPPDTCGAYLPAPALAHPGVAAAASGAGEVWSPVHRQWCTLLQFSSALLRTLGQHVDVEREALDLLLVLEPRLLLAVLPPGGDVLQPLTLAGLVEAEAALFLLTQMSSYLGGWHMVLPASLLNFRTAVSTLLTWLAQPSLSKTFAVDCRPRTAREAALAALSATGLSSAEGWFRACTAGAAAGGAAPSPPIGVSGAAGTSGPSSPLGVSGIPAAAAGTPGLRSVGSTSISGTPRGVSEGNGGGGGVGGTPGLATPGLGAAPATPVRAGSGLGAAGMSGGGAGMSGGAGGGGGGGVCSEYSWQLAEKLYSCAAHALVFLAASSPQLSEGEAASLGPAWPRPRDLSALLDQCMAASEALSYHPAADLATAGSAPGRRVNMLRLLGRVGQLCGQFLAVLNSAGAAGGAGGGVGGGVGTAGVGLSGGALGGASVREQQAREWLVAMELGGGAGAGGNGVGAGGLGFGSMGPHSALLP